MRSARPPTQKRLSAKEFKVLEQSAKQQTDDKRSTHPQTTFISLNATWGRKLLSLASNSLSPIKYVLAPCWWCVVSAAAKRTRFMVQLTPASCQLHFGSRTGFTYREKYKTLYSAPSCTWSSRVSGNILILKYNRCIVILVIKNIIGYRLGSVRVERVE